MQVPDHAYAVILAGGGGTRLWPKSRQKHPKHLLKLFGQESMLQLTFKRVAKVLPADHIFIITRHDHLEEAQSQLPDFPKENWIVEPQAKNTALAMGIASVYVGKRDPEAVMINLPADQMILEDNEFARSMVAALQIAKREKQIVAIGIRPNFPHIGLGYIRTGEQIDVADDKRTYVFGCRGFKEKPDLATAQAFLASGQYLWNAGWYCWSVATINEAMSEHAPEIYQAMEQVGEAVGTKDEQKVLEQLYEAAENVQIDVAISEKAKNLVVIPGEFTWSDIGDWKAMYDAGEKDQKGNVIAHEENYFGIDNRNCLFENNGRMIAVIGLENIVVVDTDNALLICDKSRSQDVKKIVEKLKEQQRDDLL